MSDGMADRTATDGRIQPSADCAAPRLKDAQIANTTDRRRSLADEISEEFR